LDALFRTQTTTKAANHETQITILNSQFSSGGSQIAHQPPTATSTPTATPTAKFSRNEVVVVSFCPSPRRTQHEWPFTIGFHIHHCARNRNETEPQFAQKLGVGLRLGIEQGPQQETGRTQLQSVQPAPTAQPVQPVQTAKPVQPIQPIQPIPATPATPATSAPSSQAKNRSPYRSTDPDAHPPTHRSAHSLPDLSSHPNSTHTHSHPSPISHGATVYGSVHGSAHSAL